MLPLTCFNTYISFDIYHEINVAFSEDSVFYFISINIQIFICYPLCGYLGCF